jgi:hypothetical protein
MNISEKKNKLFSRLFGRGVISKFFLFSNALPPSPPRRLNSYLFSLNKLNLAQLLPSLFLSHVIDTYNLSFFLTFGTEPVSLERGTGFLFSPGVRLRGAHALRRGSNKTRSSK